MKTLLQIILSFLASSCVFNHGGARVKYKSHGLDRSASDNSIYLMTIPKGFKVITLVGGHDEFEKQYIYTDSARIYISDFTSSVLNYNNILSLGDNIARERFKGIELEAAVAAELKQKYIPKPITLQGENSKGCWRDSRVGFLSVGYVNVPKSRKEEFDKALGSFEKK